MSVCVCVCMPFNSSFASCGSAEGGLGLGLGGGRGNKHEQTSLWHKGERGGSTVESRYMAIKVSLVSINLM